MENAIAGPVAIADSCRHCDCSEGLQQGRSPL